MIEPVSSEQFTRALGNAILLALWPVLPGLLLGYLRQSVALRRVRPDFVLRPSEKRELDRAIRLYREVRSRLKTIERADQASSFWRRIFTANNRIGSGDAEEFEDLQAHADILRETIVRLRRRPLRRLRSWMRLVSSKVALSRALAAHVVGFALLLVVFHVPDQPAFAGDLTGAARQVLGWYPFDGRLFYANAIAAGFAAGAALVFYSSQWAALRRQYSFEFCAFSELAHGEPTASIDQADSDEADGADRACAAAHRTETDAGWCSVLGVPPSATIEEVKQAYKSLIKQSHPDRVHGLSPAFRQLAETETQKLNAALRQALLDVSPPDPAASSPAQAA